MKQIINSEMLIIFFTLILLSNLYYIFFVKIGMLLVIALAIILIYLSQHMKENLRGLIILWIGLIMLLFGLLSNPYTLIVLFSFIIIIAIRYIIYKRQPMKVIQTEDDKMIINKQSLFSFQSTPDKVYKFEDINLQHAVGDINIDLSQAANLKNTNIVVVRNMIGKTTITLPYHYQVKVDYTTMYGELVIQDVYTKKARNERLTYESVAYANNIVIKLFVSSIVGDLEVHYR
ncbi:cell wall-active antibiotics response protein LiaF [Macrococcoides caseolyticum]|uniref:cell wall-active antibiotics response protein LiaF n=1 Tax=Macrococcoides caseolyticum TaxID=69966 RepID=UPI001F2FA2B9|nr:cell wall-active antibiotics response protein LiaF [Macrococcus caseolyticus]MCE4957502.1 cell wall-active antibiotics response protein [Macrococcus caseolyticus]